MLAPRKPARVVLDEKAPPLKAMLTPSGMSGQGRRGRRQRGRTSCRIRRSDYRAHSQGWVSARMPHKACNLANGETVTLMSGQDTQFVTGGQMRVHTGQAIGVLGGAVKAGEGRLGLQLIAAKDAIDIQAQADELKVQARDEVNVISANAHVDWAAAKKISLSTAGGANITIEGGNITVQCPGKMGASKVTDENGLISLQQGFSPEKRYPSSSSLALWVQTSLI
jgi:type VI secretion system secreted protein VgrG